MNFELVKVRITSFLYEAGTLVLAGILGVLGSPEFASLVKESFGETVIGTLVMLVVMGVVKHFRNAIVVGRAQKMGASGDVRMRTYLI